jgi:hypothetical protein
MFQLLNILSHVSAMEANPLALEDNDVRSFSTYKSRENQFLSISYPKALATSLTSTPCGHPIAPFPFFDLSPLLNYDLHFGL